jgi:hypothetical protein
MEPGDLIQYTDLLRTGAAFPVCCSDLCCIFPAMFFVFSLLPLLPSHAHAPRPTPSPSPPFQPRQLSRYSDWATVLIPRFRFSAGARDISLPRSVLTGFEVCQTSCAMHTGDKPAEAWSWPLASIYVRHKEWWRCTSTLPHVFMSQCLII